MLQHSVIYPTDNGNENKFVNTWLSLCLANLIPTKLTHLPYVSFYTCIFIHHLASDVWSHLTQARLIARWVFDTIPTSILTNLTKYRTRSNEPFNLGKRHRIL